MTDEHQTQKPATTIRAGNVKATVWENTTKEGKTYHSVSVIRSYKDGEQWKETNSFFRDDLPKVELVTRKAYEFIQLDLDHHTEKSEAPDQGFADRVKNERSQGSGSKAKS